MDGPTAAAGGIEAPLLACCLARQFVARLFSHLAANSASNTPEGGEEKKDG